MPISDEKTKRFAANSIFPSFFYGTLGLVLSQAGAVQMHGSWGLHVFLGMPGLTLSGLALFRARRHWTATRADMPSLSARSLGWSLLLLAAGACIGVVVAAGSAMFLGTVAALTYFLPWAKIPVCRARFVMSSVLILTGVVAWVVIFGRPTDPFYLMIAAWMLYVCSMFMTFLVVVSLDRGYRIYAPHVIDKSDLDAHVPLPQ